MYDSMRRDSDALKMEIKHLNNENEKLLKQLELARSAQTDYSKGASSGTADSSETVKRLKKRELECQALWDTLKEQV